MFKGLNKIFWGFVIITFHINTSYGQIFPNFIGWGLIASGIYYLNRIYENKKFMISGKLSTITCILSAISIFIYANVGTNTTSLFVVVFTVMFSILELFVVFYLFDGYLDYLLAENKPELVSYFTKQLRYLIIVFIVDIILESLVLTFQNNSISTYVLGLALIVRVWLLFLISHLKKLHENDVDNKGIET